MDDMLILDSKAGDLQAKFDVVHRELQQWGLSMNLVKSSLHASEATEGRCPRLQGVTLQAMGSGEPPVVMGTPIAPGITPGD